MVDWRLLGSALLFGAAVWTIQTSATVPKPIAAGRIDPALSELESAVSRDPTDATALRALVSEYVDRRAPGLAEAAITRAPAEIQTLAEIADYRAQTLAQLGNTRVALDVQRSVLVECRRSTCSQTLVGRAMRRAEWLEQMVGLGVDDAAREPARALLAYRLATRDVRLEID